MGWIKIEINVIDYIYIYPLPHEFSLLIFYGWSKIYNTISCGIQCVQEKYLNNYTKKVESLKRPKWK